jgi:cytochrome c
MRAVLILGLCSLLTSTAAAADGDSKRGQKFFGACSACHSLKPDVNMTGPSLAGVWHRRAGSLPSLRRYSPAIKNAQIIWDEPNLDNWLANPSSMIPGNRMKFPGIKDARARADLIAFLALQNGRGVPGPQGVV